MKESWKFEYRPTCTLKLDTSSVHVYYDSEVSYTVVVTFRPDLVNIQSMYIDRTSLIVYSIVQYSIVYVTVHVHDIHTPL